MTEREMAAAWFDVMPKSLKLLYIAKNPDCESVMRHYRSWNTKQLTFYDMLTSTQHLLVREHEKLYP